MHRHVEVTQRPCAEIHQIRQGMAGGQLSRLSIPKHCLQTILESRGRTLTFQRISD
jgi:hypothetical protein